MIFIFADCFFNINSIEDLSGFSQQMTKIWELLYNNKNLNLTGLKSF